MNQNGNNQNTVYQKIVLPDSIKLSNLGKPLHNNIERQPKTVVDQTPVEKTEILMSDAIFIETNDIRIMGVKIGDEISKLESLLCKQGIKYNFDQEVDHPSRLLAIDHNYIFVLSDKAAKFYLEVLCDDGYKISSFFFKSEDGSDFCSLLDAINDTSGLFLKSKHIKSKKKVMDQVLCIRQDFYTAKSVAKIERNEDVATLEIMSVERFEKLVVKWFEKKKTKDLLYYISYFLLLIIYPIYNISNKVNNSITISVGDLLIDLICSWFIVSVIGIVVYGFYLFFSNKDRDNGGCIIFYFLIIALPISFAILSKSCEEEKPVERSNFINENTNIKNVSKQTKVNTVFICTGPQSKRYHRTTYCRGLESCSDDIEEIDVSEAKDRGRTPCRICY